MRESIDRRVQAMLEDVRQADSQKLDVMLAAREVVFSECPNVTERVMYGGILFTATADFGGIFISKHHVSFEFSNGYMFNDSQGILEGSGKFRRHITLKSLSDVNTKDVDNFVRQAISNV